MTQPLQRDAVEELADASVMRRAALEQARAAAGGRRAARAREAARGRDEDRQIPRVLRVEEVAGGDGVRRVGLGAAAWRHASLAPGCPAQKTASAELELDERALRVEAGEPATGDRPVGPGREGLRRPAPRASRSRAKIAAACARCPAP